MAYRIEAGLLRPNEFTIEEEEEDSPSEEEHPEDLFSKIKVSFPANDMMIVGAKVRRKIRPWQIGTVEGMNYMPGDDTRIRDVWVSFGGREATPYALSDLEQVILN